MGSVIFPTNKNSERIKDKNRSLSYSHIFPALYFFFSNDMNVYFLFSETFYTYL